MNYTYRICKESDIPSLQKNNCIMAKSTPTDTMCVRDLLQMATAHVKYGSDRPTCWISTSNSLARVIEGYNLSTVSYQTGRNPLLVIKDNAENVIQFRSWKPITNFCLTEAQRNILWQVPAQEITEMTLNFSVRKDSKELLKNGFLLTKKGNIPENDILALSYTAKSRELITLSSIPKRKVVAALTPLEADLLYAYHLQFKEVDTSTLIGFIRNLSFPKLTPTEQFLFTRLYVDNIQLTDVTYELWLEHREVDILQLFQCLLEIKRGIFRKYLPVKNATIFLPEDTLSMIRLGEVDVSKSYFKHNGLDFALPVLPKQVFIENIALGDFGKVGLVVRQNENNQISWLEHGVVKQKKLTDEQRVKVLTHQRIA